MYDSVATIRGVENLITEEMILAVRNARDRYQEYLQKRQKEELGKISDWKKRKLPLDIKNLEIKMQKIQESLSNEIDAVNSEIEILKKLQVRFYFSISSTSCFSQLNTICDSDAM